MMAMCTLDQLADIPGMGPVGEIRLIPDPETFVRIPYLPHAASMISHMITLDGQPWDACPRSFLKKMINQLAKKTCASWRV